MVKKTKNNENIYRHRLLMKMKFEKINSRESFILLYFKDCKIYPI